MNYLFTIIRSFLIGSIFAFVGVATATTLTFSFVGDYEIPEGWECSLNVTTNGLYFNSKEHTIKSQEFRTPIKSLTLNGHKTAACTRKISINVGDNTETFDSTEMTPNLDYSFYTITLPNPVAHSFTINCIGGSQLLYIQQIYVECLDPPNIPQNPRVNIDGNQATFSWDEVENCTYKVRITNPRGELTEICTDLTTITYNFEKIGTHAFCVSAIDSAQSESDDSEIIRTSYMPDEIILEPPQINEITNNYETLTFVWENADYADSYIVSITRNGEMISEGITYEQRYSCQVSPEGGAYTISLKSRHSNSKTISQTATEITYNVDPFLPYRPLYPARANSPYNQNFGTLSTNWENGRTLRGWQISEPKITFQDGTINLTRGGIFQCLSGEGNYGIGYKTTGDKDISILFSITNNATAPIESLTISLRAFELCAAQNTQTMEIEYTLSEEIITPSTQSSHIWSPLLTYTNPNTCDKIQPTEPIPSETLTATIPFPQSQFPPGKIFTLRFSSRKLSNAPIIGIDDLSITWKITYPFIIIFK